MNEDRYKQTGRTTRMLEAASQRAEQEGVEVVVMMLTRERVDQLVKVNRFPSSMDNVIVLAATDYVNVNYLRGVITIKGEEYDLFTDHEVIEQIQRNLVPLAHKYDAKPGEFGYKEGN